MTEITVDRNDPIALRHAVRAGTWTSPTAGLAPGYLQCNLAVLPQAEAEMFEAYCRANPAVCPIVAVSKPGDPRLPRLGADLDLRTDLPSYTVFRDGAAAERTGNVTELWREDLVAFAFGCSFSFEDALRTEGVALRYLDRGDREAIYLSSVQTEPAGDFAAPLIVSMRPLRPADAILAITATARYPEVHGGPVHIGKPAMIGVDLGKPFDTIGRIRVLDDELPVFWACGVTPQLAIANAKPDFAITHTSAHMLITDLRLSELRTG